MTEKKFPSKITYKELAKISNVGTGTLSRYFNSGYISEKSKNRIKIAIEKTNFIRHGGAALINLKNNDLTIVIRTMVKSDVQDEIIHGIITKIGINTVIKYSEPEEKAMIETIKKVLEFRPKNLIIFKPINPSEKFNNILKQFSNKSKIVVYNYKNDFVSSVLINIDKALQKMSEKYDVINFIYNNEKDKNLFQDKLMKLNNYFKKVETFQELKKVKNFEKELVLFQNNNIYKNQLSLNNELLFNLKSLLITSEKMNGLLKPKHFIFINYFEIGLNLGNLCYKTEITNIEISGKIIY